MFINTFPPIAIAPDLRSYDRFPIASGVIVYTPSISDEGRGDLGK